ncbi:MAG: extracellular solute-binding protein [Lachnospiraceae bacterium]|nr:extracellular solute-binding protein [Lachnospiraceae bacterium]MBQ8232308.1 extracellular solute-binding protein [Lachnospiraceae bacterium]
MRREFLKRIFGVTLITALAMGTVACGSTDGTNTAEQSTVNVSEESSQTISTQESENSEEASADITYPLQDAEKLTLWATTPGIASIYSDYTESPYHMGLQENTGVEVEWTFPALGANWKESYNLLLTEDTLPDIIAYSINVSAAQLLAQDGVIYDLTDYIPKYAPDYWEYLNAEGNEAVLKAAKSEDGRIYGVRTSVETELNPTYIGPVIRQDWLDELNLEVPVTLVDWENVLVAFKEKYNAKLGFVKGKWNMGIASGVNAQAGLSAEYYVDADGKIQFANAQPEWKESLEVLHKWYEMGLIDQDSFTMNDDALRTKVLNNEIGVSITAMSQLTNWCLDAEKQNPGAVWVGMEYPRVAAGVPTSRIQGGNRSGSFVAVITKECTEEKMITALKWLNYGYTEDGFMYQNFGTEGTNYTLDSDGKPHWTDLMKNDPDGLEQAIIKYTGTYSSALGGIQSTDMVLIKNHETAAEAVYKWAQNTDNSKYLLPSLAMTDEESLVITDVATPIKAYVGEMALKYVLGEASLDDFDAFVAELDKMGLQKCLDAYQAAYDRYLAR